MLAGYTHLLRGSQAVQLSKGYRFEGAESVLIYRLGSRVIFEPAEPEWGRELLDFAGAVPDFPYPEEPPPAEPGPNFDG